MHFENYRGITSITLCGMKEASTWGIKCVTTIRQWLPVNDCETLSSDLTMDTWHNAACRECFEFFKFYKHLGTYSTIGPQGSAAYWRELCDGMADVRAHYKWESIDFENRFPHADVRGGEILEPIHSRLLARVEQAGNALLAFGDIPSPWKEHDAATAMRILGIKSRDTIGKHAESADHPYIEWVQHGRYRLDHSHPIVVECKEKLTSKSTR